MFIGYAERKKSKGWADPAEVDNLVPLENLDTLYILVDSEKKRFFVLIIWEQGFPSSEQSYHLLHVKNAANEAVDVNNAVWNRLNRLDAAFQFVTYLVLDHIILAKVQKRTSY